MKIVLAAILLMAGVSAHALIAPNRMCTQEISFWYNPTTKEQVTARNGCQAQALREQGFINGPMPTPVDQPAEKSNDLTKALSVITTGKYRIVDNSCRADRICVPTTMHRLAQSQLELSLTTKGCLDSAFITYKVVAETNTVIVSAINVANEASKNVRCFAPNVVVKTIDLGFSVSAKEDLNIEFVQTLAK